MRKKRLKKVNERKRRMVNKGEVRKKVKKGEAREGKAKKKKERK